MNYECRAEGIKTPSRLPGKQNPRSEKLPGSSSYRLIILFPVREGTNRGGEL